MDEAEVVPGEPLPTQVVSRELLERIRRDVLARLFEPYRLLLAAKGIDFDALRDSAQDDHTLIHPLHDLVNSGEAQLPPALVAMAVALDAVGTDWGHEQLRRLDKKKELPQAWLGSETLAAIAWLDHAPLFAQVRVGAKSNRVTTYKEYLPRSHKPLPRAPEPFAALGKAMGEVFAARGRPEFCEPIVTHYAHNSVIDFVFGRLPGTVEQLTTSLKRETGTQVITQRLRALFHNLTGALAVQGRAFEQETIRRLAGLHFDGRPESLLRDERLRPRFVFDRPRRRAERGRRSRGPVDRAPRDLDPARGRPAHRARPVRGLLKTSCEADIRAALRAGGTVEKVKLWVKLDVRAQPATVEIAKGEARHGAHGRAGRRCGAGRARAQRDPRRWQRIGGERRAGGPRGAGRSERVVSRELARFFDLFERVGGRARGGPVGARDGERARVRGADEGAHRLARAARGETSVRPSRRVRARSSGHGARDGEVPRAVRTDAAGVRSGERGRSGARAGADRSGGARPRRAARVRGEGGPRLVARTEGEGSEPIVLGAQEGVGAAVAVRDAFFASRPGEQLAGAWLGLRERATRRAVVFVPTASAVGAERMGRHGGEDRVEVVALEDAVGVGEGGGVVRAGMGSGSGSRAGSGSGSRAGSGSGSRSGSESGLEGADEGGVGAAGADAEDAGARAADGQDVAGAFRSASSTARPSASTGRESMYAARFTISGSRRRRPGRRPARGTCSCGRVSGAGSSITGGSITAGRSRGDTCRTSGSGCRSCSGSGRCRSRSRKGASTARSFGRGRGCRGRSEGNGPGRSRVTSSRATP